MKQLNLIIIELPFLSKATLITPFVDLLYQLNLCDHTDTKYGNIRSLVQTTKTNTKVEIIHLLKYSSVYYFMQDWLKHSDKKREVLNKTDIHIP